MDAFEKQQIKVYAAATGCDPVALGADDSVRERKHDCKHDRRAALHIAAELGVRGEDTAVTLARADVFVAYMCGEAVQGLPGEELYGAPGDELAAACLAAGRAAVTSCASPEGLGLPAEHGSPSPAAAPSGERTAELLYPAS